MKKWEYFVEIFFVSMTSKNNENDVEKSKTNKSNIDGFVQEKISMGKSSFQIDFDR